MTPEQLAAIKAGCRCFRYVKPSGVGLRSRLAAHRLGNETTDD